MGKTEDASKSSFRCFRDLANVAQRSSRTGGFAIDTIASGDTPVLLGSGKLANSLVVDGHGGSSGSSQIWGRTPRSGGGVKLPTSNAGPRKAEPKRSVARERRDWLREGQERQGQEEGGAKPVRDGCVSHEKIELPQAPPANLFALINISHGSFARYWRIHCRSEMTGAETFNHLVEDTQCKLFPSRLPWCEPPGKSKHRRGLSKTVVDEAFQWMHTVWALFNFFSAGSPASRKGAMAAVARTFKNPWTAQHERYARTVFKKLLGYCAQPRGTLERGTSKLSELISKIRMSQYDPDIDLNEALCGAKPVDPKRISLPEKGGIIDPRDHLVGDQLEKFCNMPRLIPRDCPYGEDIKACHKVEDKDLPELLRKLHRSNMITFLRKSDVLAEGRKLIKGGLFCVPHKPESDRVINDRRPLNLREERLEWCQLPSGPMLCQLILDRAESVRASGDDLSNYFYLIKHLDQWQHRNAFGKPFRGSLLPEFGLKSDQLYVPAFKVLCMGDRNGVDLAQATHESILRKVGCLDPHETIIYGKVFPPTRTLEGLYIDDHLTFQIVKNKSKRDRGPEGDEILIQKSRDRYSELGLPRSEKKAFDKHYDFKAWGTQVCSQSGNVSAPPIKLRQIESLTSALLTSGVATKKCMQKLVGLYVHPYMHRRECMCVFQHVYHFIERMQEGVNMKIPQHVVDELITAALILPLASSNIRWPVSTQISATDASSNGGGRCATLTTKALSKTLYRFGEKKGEYTRLDWQSHSLDPPTSMERTPESLVDSLMKHQWVETESITFGCQKHINLLEMDMLCSEIKHRVSSGRGNCRVVNLCDSRVVVGSFAKGRSSSVQLNHRLRSCMPWLLAGNLSVTNLCVSTKSNPADYPSRGLPIPSVNNVVGAETDPLLSPRTIKASGVFRPPTVQRFLEQESQRLGVEPFDSPKVPHTCLLEPPQVDTGDSRQCCVAKPPETRGGSKPKVKFREIFSGKAGLSRAVENWGEIEVLEPVDLKHGKKCFNNDILDDACFSQLKKDAKEENQLWHFGLPCASFSILQIQIRALVVKHYHKGMAVLKESC